MIEASLIVDSYGRNKLYTGDTAMIHQIYNLCMMDPGTDPLNPEKGVDVMSYRYEFNDNAELVKLQERIKEQISDYTPYTVTNVICKGIKNRAGNYILHVFISLNEVNEIINVTTDGEKSELAVIDL